MGTITKLKKKHEVTFLCILFFFMICLKANADISSDLICFYPFDKDLINKQGTGYNAVKHGNLQFSKGVNGNAIMLNGTDAYATVNNFQDLKNMTIAFHFKIIRLSSTWNVVLSFEGPNDELIFCFYNSTERMLRIEKKDDGSSAVTDSLSINKFYHFAFVNDFDNEKQLIYLDGKLIHTFLIQQDFNTSAKIKIGYENSGSSLFNGLIDNLRIYSRALSRTDISELYNSYYNETLVSGCLNIKQMDSINGRAMLVQSGELHQKSIIDNKGCFEFFQINRKKPFSIHIRGNTEGKED